MKQGKYEYPSLADNETLGYFLGIFIIVVFILLFTDSYVGEALLVGTLVFGSLIMDYDDLQGAEYIVTHYPGEDAIREAMELTKEARNNSILVWAFGGFLFFMEWGVTQNSLGTYLVGLGNLANFIMIFVAHGRYSELRKMLMILQLKKSDKAEISIKI